MAEKIDDIDLSEEGDGKSKKMIIIIAVVVLALAGAGGWFFLAGGGDEAAEGEAAKEVIQVKQTPIYATVDKAFVVNFADQSNNEVRYLQIKLKVMARDQAVIDAFTLNTPAIQHELLILFFDQKYDALNTQEGKSALKEQSLSTINKVLKAEQTEGELEAVYFTSLIMQ
ncbi:MAG: flagellar basal body-associated FliL family protein [Methylophaga sp.]|nr:flagellar basal body-associated FliL family protein [Methylophaga sp.]